MPETKGSAWTDLLPLSACLLLASFLIFDHIGARSFWLDEAGAANQLSYPFAELYRRAVANADMLLYIYFLKIWASLFGDGEVALRCFSALFGLLLVAFTYTAGRGIFRSRRAGLLSAFLAATNCSLVWFSTQNRMYTLAPLVGLLSFYFFIMLHRRRRAADYLLYVLFTAAGAYTHPWLLLVFGSQVLGLLLSGRRDGGFGRILSAQATAALLSLPGALVLLRQGGGGASAWIGGVGPAAVLESLKYLSFGSMWPYLLLTLLALLAALRQGVLAEELRDARGRLAVTYLLLYLFFPLVSAWMLSYVRPVYAVGRYDMIVLPAFLLLLGRLWSMVPGKWFYCLAVPVLAAAAYMNVLDDRMRVRSFRSDDRRMAAVLLEELGEGDTVIATDLTWSSFSYYFRRLNAAREKRFAFLSFPRETMDHPGWKKVPRTPAEREEYGREADALVGSLRSGMEEGKRIWVLYRVNNPANAILRDRLEENFRLVDLVAPPRPHQKMWLDFILVYDGPRTAGVREEGQIPGGP